jgi:hypothetical protein
MMFRTTAQVRQVSASVGRNFELRTTDAAGHRSSEGPPTDRGRRRDGDRKRPGEAASRPGASQVRHLTGGHEPDGEGDRLRANQPDRDRRCSVPWRVLPPEPRSSSRRRARFTSWCRGTPFRARTRCG